MKPRIVRERYTAETFPPSLHEAFVGEPWLALKWPKVGTGPGECPYTPEQVMAACERRGLGLDSIAKPNVDGVWWVRVVSSLGHSGWTENLTPEFIGEPKRCEHESILDFRCHKCGIILSDRRHEVRRKGERRRTGRLYGGGRRKPPDGTTNFPGHDRRSSLDRRYPYG